MTIKEVESILNIPRASIRFYEKEGLISPARKENDYRDYSEGDVEILRKVIIFRKLGLPIDQIKDVLSEELGLAEAMNSNIKVLESKMDEISGAIEVCREINCDIGDFDSDKYWTEIFEKERSGKKFFDIAKDSMDYQKKFFLHYFGNVNIYAGYRAFSITDDTKYTGSKMLALMSFFAYLQCYGAISARTRFGPIYGIIVSALTYFLLSFSMWITYNLAQKNPEKEKTIIRIRRLVGVAILICGLIAIIIPDKVQLHPAYPIYNKFVIIMWSVFFITYGIQIIRHKEKPTWFFMIITLFALFILTSFLPIGVPGVHLSQIFSSFSALLSIFKTGILEIILYLSFLFFIIVDAVALWKKY